MEVALEACSIVRREYNLLQDQQGVVEVQQVELHQEALAWVHLSLAEAEVELILALEVVHFSEGLLVVILGVEVAAELEVVASAGHQVQQCRWLQGEVEACSFPVALI